MQAPPFRYFFIRRGRRSAGSEADQKPEDWKKRLTPQEVYEPQEDSELLLSVIRKLGLSGKLACDMGTGSGILANELAKGFGAVVAADVNPAALDPKNFAAKNIRPVESDLFSGIPERRFDLVVFNSPYLPGDEDARWSCGPDAKVVADFLARAAGRLSEKGEILLLISSLTPPQASAAARRLFRRVEIAGERRLPGFETLFVLRLSGPKGPHAD